MKSNRASAGALALAGVLLVAKLAVAQPASQPKLIGSSQVIEEVVHPIRIYAWQPPLDVSGANVAPGTAEQVVIRWIEAMRRGDYDAALGAFDETSRLAILDRSRKEGISREGWLRKWKDLFENRGVRLTYQVTFGPAVMIEYEVVDANQVAVTSEPVVLLKDAAGAYQLTLKYADHAAVQGWKLPNKRVQRLGRTN